MRINTLVIVVILMLGSVVSDTSTPYPYYDHHHHDESTNSSTPSLPYNSQSPNLAKGKKKSSPPPPSKLPPPPPPVVHFDFFKLVERWPKTFCFTKTCRTDIQPKFVIHGLWPSITAPSGSQPEDCGSGSQGNVEFSKFAAPVYNQLRTEWPSLIYKKAQLIEDIGFWTYQWKKHGTCSSIVKAEDYFKLALDIHKRTILKDVLQKKSILPNYTKTRKREDIFDAIKDAIDGKNPEILCVEYKNN